MRYRSTREKANPCLISEAIQNGLASDGGLYVPENWPVLKINPAWAKLPLSEFAALILEPFFDDDPLQKELKNICTKAFNFSLPLEPLKQKTHVLELFHGPTNAFKDLGARFLAQCLQVIKSPKNLQKMVLVATSGDTGGAVAAAFCEGTDIPVTILYPRNQISQRQEQQLTCWGDQVQAFAVNGSFDDCQKMVKEAFVSPWWQNHFNLISANSINLGRLLPQMVYFAYSSLQYMNANGVAPGFIIPSGNVGNAVAALWAQKLGFPLRQVVFAHNANTTVKNYFATGDWNPRASVNTLANAMDVGNPSNFERVISLYPKLEDLKKVASAYSVSDEQIRLTIQQGPTNWGKIWCPHTAVAVYVREQQQESDWIIVATAHPAKFETIIEPLINQKIDTPVNLQKQLQRPSKSTVVNANLKDLETLLSSNF